jgi:2-methylcitrate dehydratase PrpD
VNISRQLAEHIVRTRYESLPDSVIAVSKRAMLDTIAVAWAGSTAPGIPEVHSLITSEGGKPESTVWAYGDRVPAAAAAFLNSALAGALDYDSVHQEGSVHADIVVLPVSVALAQRQHLTGSEFITAFAIGTDLTCRLGRSALRNSGWFFTSIHGALGAAAAAAKLLRLDVGATENALGIALSQIGGTQQALMEKSLMKRVQSGFAARAGVFSALLAASGITGPREAFEGKFGFYAMYEEGNPEKLLSGLGKEFENLNTTTKKYPSCTCNHTLIEGVIQLVQEHRLTKDDIAGVEVIISPFMNQLVGAPFDPNGNPQVAAQFSAQYSVASAILRQRLGIAEIQDDAVLDPTIKELTNLVKVVVDEKNTGKFAPSEIIITTKQHGQLRRRMDQVPGTPEHPLSDKELENKFRECAMQGALALADEKSELLMKRIADVENIPDMDAFFNGVI